MAHMTITSAAQAEGGEDHLLSISVHLCPTAVHRTDSRVIVLPTWSSFIAEIQLHEAALLCLRQPATTHQLRLMRSAGGLLPRWQQQGSVIGTCHSWLDSWLWPVPLFIFSFSLLVSSIILFLHVLASASPKTQIRQDFRSPPANSHPRRPAVDI